MELRRGGSLARAQRRYAPRRSWSSVPRLRKDHAGGNKSGESSFEEWSADTAIVRRAIPSATTPFKVFGSFAGLRPLSERLLKLPPQLICLPLRKPPKVLFKLTLHLVPGTFDLKLVH